MHIYPNKARPLAVPYQVVGGEGKACNLRFSPLAYELLVACGDEVYQTRSYAIRGIET